MSDPPKVVVKSTRVSIRDPSEDESDLSPRNSTVNGGSARRQSRPRSTRRSDANIESITLQETRQKSQPVTLKASFLRRKAKEYEGNRAIRLSAIHAIQLPIDSLKSTLFILIPILWHCKKFVSSFYGLIFTIHFPGISIAHCFQCSSSIEVQGAEGRRRKLCSFKLRARKVSKGCRARENYCGRDSRFIWGKHHMSLWGFTRYNCFTNWALGYDAWELVSGVARINFFRRSEGKKGGVEEVHASSINWWI